jgi:phthalate 4,5-dioxygenase oxygenase subunit
MVWNFFATYGKEPIEDEVGRGNTYGVHVDEKNGFKSIYNRSNNWMIDRDMQRNDTFTGIDGINTQDRAVQESMGPIVDRTKEHLGPADRPITVARRLLLEATDAVERNEDPLGLSPNYDDLRPAEGVFAAGKSWRNELIPQMVSGARLEKVSA